MRAGRAVNTKDRSESERRSPWKIARKSQAMVRIFSFLPSFPSLHYFALLPTLQRRGSESKRAVGQKSKLVFSILANFVFSHIFSLQSINIDVCLSGVKGSNRRFEASLPSMSRRNAYQPWSGTKEMACVRVANCRHSSCTLHTFSHRPTH